MVFSYTVIKNENHSQLNKMEFSHEKIGLFVLLLLFSLLSLVIGVKDIALSQLFQLDAHNNLFYLPPVFPAR